MVHEKLSRSPLLKADKTLTEEGWARAALWDYSRKEAKSPYLRENDGYLVADRQGGFMMLFEFAAAGMKARHRITYVDIARGECAEVESSKVSVLRHGTLPEDILSDSEMTYADQAMTMAAVKRGSKRQLLITAPYLDLPGDITGLKAHIELENGNDETISAASAEKDDGTRWCLRSIESPLAAEGIMFVGHKPVMLSPSASGAFWYSRSKLQRSIVGAMILGDGWSLCAGEDRYINSITYRGCIDKLGSMIFSRTADRWIASEENSRVEIEARPIATAGSEGNAREFIKCAGSFTLSDGQRIAFSDALGIISSQIR